MKALNCILLIDDNVDDNYYHTIIIQEANAAYHVRTATTGEKALEYLLEGKECPDQFPFPNLVFLDINMPGMNGFEFLEKVKEIKLLDSGKSIIVVMLTSSLNPVDKKMVKDFFSGEVKAFKNKPLTTEMLADVIEKFF